MNNKTKYEELIFKLLTDNISEEEITDLENWVKTEKNKKTVEEYIQLNHAANSMLQDSNALKAYNVVAQKTKKLKKLKTRFFKYAAAASILLVVALTVFLNTRNNEFQFVEPTIVKTNIDIEPGTDKATLTLEDGSQIALEKGASFQTQNANSNGETIVYEAGKRNKKEIAYNYLTIPRGGQFFVKLSDGTQVWLNSESQLKYPISFIEGETRQVELVYGEAYFDVSPSTNHKGAKFKVFNNAQEIEVLGTEFNLKAYKDETSIYTTLVEGKVAINTSTGKKILAPNQQSNFNTLNKEIDIAVVDVDEFVSWKNGIFSFKGKPLKAIMKVISRWYDVDVVFEDKNLESVKFKGVLSKQQNIDEILSIMKSSTINDYEIINKTIILK